MREGTTNDTEHDDAGPHYPYRNRLKREKENIQGEIKQVVARIKEIERKIAFAKMDAENMREVDPTAARGAERLAKRLTEGPLTSARGELRRLRKEEREQNSQKRLTRKRR